MRLPLVFALSLLAVPAAFAQAGDPDEVNRRFQGQGEVLTAPPMPGQTAPLAVPSPVPQDQDRRNGTIHLQGGQAGRTPPLAPAAPIEQDQDARNGTIHLQGGHAGQAADPAAASTTAVVTGDGLLSVAGTGEAAAEPDMAIVSSGVTTQATTAREALDANSLAMNQLIGVLREAGIEERDIQTSGFSVQPQYVYSDERDASGYTRPPRIVGYQVANTVTVRVRNLGSLGDVLDRAVTVGANTINGISFDVDDPSKLYEQARRAAYADALAKARTYAELAMVTLGEIALINEGVSAPPPMPYAMAGLAERAVAAPVPIQSGEMAFTVNVEITWTLESR